MVFIGLGFIGTGSDPLTEVVFSKFFVKNISSIQCTKQSVQMSHKKQKIPPMFL